MLINRDIVGLPRVLIDTQVAVTDAIGFLIESGHRDIAYLSGPKESWSNQQRLEAAGAACRRPVRGDPAIRTQFRRR